MGSDTKFRNIFLVYNIVEHEFVKLATETINIRLKTIKFQTRSIKLTGNNFTGKLKLGSSRDSKWDRLEVIFMIFNTEVCYRVTKFSYLVIESYLESYLFWCWGFSIKVFLKIKSLKKKKKKSLVIWTETSVWF